jgi:hypothetical protein
MNDDHKTDSDPKTNEHHGDEKHDDHTDTHDKPETPSTPSTDGHTQ